MSHDGEERDVGADRGERRSNAGVATAAETLVVPIGLALDVATSLSSARR